MLRGAYVDNVVQLEYVGKQAAKEVQQYSDVVTDLTSEKALLLVNRRLAKAEEHTRQLLAQLKAKNEQVDDLSKLNIQLQNLLEIKDERLEGALSTQKSLEESAAIARQQRDEALLEVKRHHQQGAVMPEVMEQNARLEDQVKESGEKLVSLQQELLEATSSSKRMQQEARSLRDSNTELQKQADVANQTLQHEKQINAKLQEHNKELLKEYRQLEESRDRVLEVIEMYKGKIGNLSEQVEDLQIDSVSKSVYLARNQARIVQLSSVVATQQHHQRRGTSVAPSAIGGSPAPSVFGASAMPTPRSRHERSRHGQLNEGPSCSDEDSPIARSHSRPAPLQPAKSASILRRQSSVGSSYPPHGSAPSPIQQVQQPSHLNAPHPSGAYHQAHPMAGQVPSKLESRTGSVAFHPPGMAGHVGPVRAGRQGQQHSRVPAGHAEWEEALQAAAHQHSVQEAVQQHTQWMAQGKGRNPDAANLGAMRGHGASTSGGHGQGQGSIDGVKRRAPPGPLPSQGEKQRTHKAVRPLYPSREYMEYNLQTGRKHLVQTQVVK